MQEKDKARKVCNRLNNSYFSFLKILPLVSVKKESAIKKMPMQRTPKDLSKIKQVETGNQSKLLIDDENLTKISKQLLEGDSYLLHNAVTENFKDNNCLANSFTTSEICEKDLPMLINKVVKNDNFINGVVEKLTEALLQNVEFNTALN